MQKNTIIKLSEIEHVLKRPGQYIGSVNECAKEMFVYKDEKFVFDSVTYVPGLDKCLNEILDNCLDEAIRTNFEYGNEIEIEIDSKSARFIDNGRGVPCDTKEDETTSLELAFNNARAGANFNDDGRQTVGMNGVGSFCVNCFSKYFVVISRTKHEIGKLENRNNLSESNCYIGKEPHKKTGTTVYFEPDFERFGVKEFNQTQIDLLYQRVVNLSICFPEISFKFNGEKVKINPKNFIKMFDENGLTYEFNNVLIGVIPNNFDDFKHYSYVNGLKILNGGTHIDLIANNIIAGTREKLQRKCKGILPGDIKHRLSLIVFFKHFNNAKFNSQTKEELTNSNSEINEYLNNNNVSYDKIIRDIIKNEAIVSPIIDAFKIKEELKVRKELKNKPSKKFKSDKYLTPIGDLKTLFVTEGFSAQGGISAVIGRQNIGYYALKGVMLNTFNSSLQKVAANQELKELSQILDFQLGTQNDDVACDIVSIATDIDPDGHHITGIFLGTLYKYARKLFEQKRVRRLVTPLVVLFDKKDKPVKYFFTLDEYKAYDNKEKYRSKYFKGLGSWKKEELEAIIEQKGLDYFLQPIILDEQSENYFNWWLTQEETDKRKEFIQAHTLDLELT